MTSTRDGGYATVWIVIAMAVVIAAAGVATTVGAATIERHRAAAAADATALKVALDALAGPTVACRDGAALARRNGATLTRCNLDGADATVEVAIRLPGVLAAFGAAHGRARAGPVSELGSP